MTAFIAAFGDSAATCLRAACQSHGMPGAAFAIPDDLSHGPLDDGRARMDCFFSSRLQVLIDAGRIVAEGRRGRLRDYAVRLAAA